MSWFDPSAYSLFSRKHSKILSSSSMSPQSSSFRVQVPKEVIHANSWFPSPVLWDIISVHVYSLLLCCFYSVSPSGAL